MSFRILLVLMIGIFVSCSSKKEENENEFTKKDVISQMTKEINRDRSEGNTTLDQPMPYDFPMPGSFTVLSDIMGGNGRMVSIVVNDQNEGKKVFEAIKNQLQKSPYSDYTYANTAGMLQAIAKHEDGSSVLIALIPPVDGTDGTMMQYTFSEMPK